ncbi:four helix bundle protein [Wenzhouxiangella sp. XN79A]|nr:four helix bundle protein [Wenzhouxiangella sp. XN79A]
MAAITRFEDIEAWQCARALAGDVYSICRRGELAHDFGLRDQMQRAAVSIMANIAEGYVRQGRRELIQFLKIARGSRTELQSHLYLALDADFVTNAEFSALQSSAEVTGR